MKVKEELGKVTLMNGYVFKTVFGGDVKLCKGLLETTCVMSLNSIDYTNTEQTMEPDPHRNRRGGRLDLYVIDSEGRHFDVEVQTVDRDNEHLRARHYQALMDINQLKKGDDASNLKGSIVVFICGFDPFEHDLVRYDTKTRCVQTDEWVDDGRLATYLSTTGKRGRDELSPELRELLDLFSGEAETDDLQTPMARDILEAMRGYANDEEWVNNFMTFEDMIEERIWLYKEEARKAREETQRANDKTRRAEEEARKANDKTRRAEEETRKANDKTRRAEEETRKANDKTRRAEEEARKANERSHRLEGDNAELRSAMARLQAEVSRLREGHDAPAREA